jgi:hypothetical protein
MAAIILVVPDQMLPKAALPDAPFTACATNLAQTLGLWYRFRELQFDQPPARREIGVVGRKRPNCVNVVRQDDKRIDSKWMPVARASRRLAERRYFLGEKAASAIQQITVKNQRPPGTNARR